MLWWIWTIGIFFTNWFIPDEGLRLSLIGTLVIVAPMAMLIGKGLGENKVKEWQVANNQTQRELSQARDHITNLLTQLDTTKDQLLRLAADFDSYRKRIRREVEELNSVRGTNSDLDKEVLRDEIRELMLKFHPDRNQQGINANEITACLSALRDKYS